MMTLAVGFATCGSCPAHPLVSEVDAFLDDHALERQLAACPLEQLALHAVRCRQPQHQHRLVLADAVAPVHRLHEQIFTLYKTVVQYLIL